MNCKCNGELEYINGAYVCKSCGLKYAVAFMDLPLPDLTPDLTVKFNTISQENKITKESNKELLDMLVKIAYCGWNMKELHEVMVKYGYEESEEEDN